MIYAYVMIITHLCTGVKVIDSIIITYDDDSVWSYGLGGGKSRGKTIVFSENEYLVCKLYFTVLLLWALINNIPVKNTEYNF